MAEDTAQTSNVAEEDAQQSSIAEEKEEIGSGAEETEETKEIGSRAEERTNPGETCYTAEDTAQPNTVGHMSENAVTEGDEEWNTTLERLEDKDQINTLKTELNLHKTEILTLNEQIKALECLTPERVYKSTIPRYFQYCTGFTYSQYNELCTFFQIPNSSESKEVNIPPALTYCKTNSYIKQMSLRQQLLMVLMKLRNNCDMKELAFKFGIDEPSVSIIFRAWVDYMYNKLASLSIWPHRDIITSQMPDKYKADYPTSFGILDCTELRIQKPSSLQLQSQTFSDYKSTNTLKALIACDPRGAVTFISTLFTGSISDREIFNQCGITTLLEGLIECGYLKKGDALMADKGFLIEKDVESLGLKLNIPPFNRSNVQMPVGDVLKTKKIAKHRVTVERAIAKIKKFKIVSGRIPNSILGNINEIWYVVSMLSNFQPHILQK
ncbi:uncharacterized protein LOC127536712 isoform X2 [Acanthochromis polyacanthus]|nr:uncharacterized protein LOC127536712 isoform X2 [Acanthochromis polyacanthus]